MKESKSVIRRKNGVLITETRHGFICANSGIDVSNVDGGEHALLLPEDPDHSAMKLHRELRKLTGLAVPVIISDSFGRPWREGLTEAAIGVAGMKAIHDYRGRRDPHGYSLRVTLDAVADELACAAGLLSSKLTRTPFVIIRGFPYQPGRGSSRSLLRPAKQDLFR
jgi:coenzyme F420-0:L-glutamate ligase/coenzyme F420-1:gamma-L-glutamate ligase